MRAAGAGGSETHFTVQVVSKEFEGKNPMQRHRLVYSTLQAELNAGLHALQIRAKTPDEAGEIMPLSKEMSPAPASP
ncbi:MAG: hypothetical protein CYPHOPRED_001214 [Cyphobasidiales sp. Tagirdzhanova-0007]|nr:MAG: hypothetical protein CYPHOPRED_001214 [Cyphobasidiales sp. Tagirdzhanova-0007]